NAANVHHLLKFFDVANLFARGDPHRTLRAETSVTLEVVRMERLFEPGEIERFELFGPPNRRRGVPAQAGIDHQFHLRADALPSGSNMREVTFFARSHWPPAELYRPITLLGQTPADPLGFLWRVAEENRRVGPKLLAEAAAQKLIHRPARRLADDVPQSDLDA